MLDEVDEERDVVDGHLEHWKGEFPDFLDLSTEGVVERIDKLARYLERSLANTAANYGLSTSDWRILGALRRLGAPYRSTPTKLAEALMMSAASMTMRLDKLVEAGLAERKPHSSDRRVVEVELTQLGIERWNEAVREQAAIERNILDELSEEEKDTLNGMLRRLMLRFERSEGPVPPHPGDVSGG